jgi:hypothetical protein
MELQRIRTPIMGEKWGRNAQLCGQCWRIGLPLSFGAGFIYHADSTLIALGFLAIACHFASVPQGLILAES